MVPVARNEDAFRLERAVDPVPAAKCQAGAVSASAADRKGLAHRLTERCRASTINLSYELLVRSWLRVFWPLFLKMT